MADFSNLSKKRELIASVGQYSRLYNKLDYEYWSAEVKEDLLKEIARSLDITGMALFILKHCM